MTIIASRADLGRRVTRLREAVMGKGSGWNGTDMGIISPQGLYGATLAGRMGGVSCGVMGPQTVSGEDECRVGTRSGHHSTPGWKATMAWGKGSG